MSESRQFLKYSQKLPGLPFRCRCPFVIMVGNVGVYVGIDVIFLELVNINLFHRAELISSALCSALIFIFIIVK